MKRKINFAPQEFSAVFTEAISTACLTAAGVPAVPATLIGSAVAGVTKGLSLSQENPSERILSSIEKSIHTILEGSQFDLPEECRELLQQDILSPKKLFHFLYRPDSRKALAEQILLICQQDPNCDIRTFPIEQLLSEMFALVEEEVKSDPSLASCASFCILLGQMPSYSVHTANQQYVSSFTEPLFLHKHESESKVTLSNLFILQKHQVLQDSSNPDEPTPKALDLQDTISAFLNTNRREFLFIEGDAGSGKTSLVAWMNYHYALQDEISEKLFGDRPLITIRLRDLDKEDISKDRSLSHAILNYMNVSSLDVLERLFPKAIMVLDGFDELCMIEGMESDHGHLLYDLYHKHLDCFQFIVTTRPKFINRGINIPSLQVFLHHFDAEQREKWLKHYTSAEYCNQNIDESVKTYIQNIDDEGSSCICDTPMTLYMLAAKKDSRLYLNNSWALYNHIFMEELSETEYNKMFPDPNRNYAHDINRLSSVIYQISEEIAYHMYKKQNERFYLSDQELSDIITELSEHNPILKRANMQDIAERCYALCCYWKPNSDRGAVEFLHNNIRDFFLAERIYRKMNVITEYASKNYGEADQHKEIAKKLCMLFPYAILETKVTEFLYLRAKYNAERNQTDFSTYEYQNKMVGGLLTYLTYSGIIESNVFACMSKNDPIQTIINIITCTAQTYRHVYEAHLRNNELIYWFGTSGRDGAKTITYNSMLITLFKQVFSLLPVTPSIDHTITMASRGDFAHMLFRNSDLRNIVFQHSNLNHAILSDTILCGCNFSHADLRFSDLTNADIHYACLTGALLDGCNMTGADLRGTELPDGFCSMDQNEQVEHLKSLNIPELII